MSSLQGVAPGDGDEYGVDRSVCPNSPPCLHAGVLHDVDEPGGRQVCCADGCSCGKSWSVHDARPATGVGEWVVDLQQPTVDLVEAHAGPRDAEGNQHLAGEWVVDCTRPPIDLGVTNVPIEENRYVALFSEGYIHGKPLATDTRGEPCRPVACPPAVEGSLLAAVELTIEDYKVRYRMNESPTGGPS